MPRKLIDTLAWAGDGAAHLRGLMTAWATTLSRPRPAWPADRAHVLTHVARNADAMINLLTWARTGVRHPGLRRRPSSATPTSRRAPDARRRRSGTT